eukprot:TRINITY_DN14647_c3_g1_i1.p1 TRINITY_DN14647_c3_g1~~TRINITY_DN14647_c3_g1_i1.p1  ORF type:complete len:267 (-),score=83.99 TRINITY_DN14647_c3_g1_i1:119-919(-)
MAVAQDNLYVTGLPAEVDDELALTIFSAYGTVTSVKVLPPRTAGEKANAMVRLASAAEAQWIVDHLNGNIPEGLDEPIGVKFASAGRSKGDTGGFGKGGYGGKGFHTMGAAPYNPPPPPVQTHPSFSGKGPKGVKGGGKDGPSLCKFRDFLDGLIKGGALPGDKLPDENQLYIKGLPADTDDVGLFQLFSAFGPISPKGVRAMKGPDGQCTGVGFVDFLDAEHAAIAQQSIDQSQMPDGKLLFVSIKNSTKGKSGKGKGGKGKFKQ